MDFKIKVVSTLVGVGLCFTAWGEYTNPPPEPPTIFTLTNADNGATMDFYMVPGYSNDGEMQIIEGVDVYNVDSPAQVMDYSPTEYIGSALVFIHINGGIEECTNIPVIYPQKINGDAPYSQQLDCSVESQPFYATVTPQSNNISIYSGIATPSQNNGQMKNYTLP